MMRAICCFFQLSFSPALGLVAAAALALVALPDQSALAAGAQIPALAWQERSDWGNVKTAITPAAIGDGKADDTAALQKALDGIKDGSIVYLPAGTYRITATLSLKNASGARWIGGLLIGCGRDTKLVWDGPAGRDMVLINGIAYTRIVGMELDGRGKAGTGFHYKATQGFQTEVTHRHLGFRGFTDSGVLEDHLDSGQALAETSFENCLFEDCGRGVAFLQFNDYDYTFDGCEFRHCGVAIDCARGNFYARNCHFEQSRTVDIRDWSEHCSSVRRCTSAGSKAFISRVSTVAPLIIQDCHVDSWKSIEGAIVLSRPPVMLFDCNFTNPPQDAAGAGTPPVRAHSDGQRLIVSNNKFPGTALLAAVPKTQTQTIPAGARTGVVRSASQSFLRDQTLIPTRVFDAKRDFGAKGDGVTDDTLALQKTIDAAAAAAANAIAYLPSGSYVVTAPLRITGHDYFVGGSGWGSRLVWKGAEGGTLVEIRDPQDVVLEDIMIGNHESGPMNNSIDVHQFGSAGRSHMTYDGVYAFGMYQKEPLRKGFRFTGLSAKEVVVVPHAQGNMRFIDCGQATILANCTYEGSIVVEGKAGGREGFLGFQTRLATGVTHGLYLRDNQNIVMSDFYVESADNGFSFEGEPGLPLGRATLQGAKVHFPTSPDADKNTAIEIRNYRGEIFFGPDQFYGEPKLMRIRQQGDSPVELFLLGCSWYAGPKPDFQFAASGKFVMIANESYDSGKDGEPAVDPKLYGEPGAEATLAKVARAMDDLRRLGQLDGELNHPDARLGSAK
jgi:hypothetical protein